MFFKVLWGPLMKGTLEVQRRIMLIIFPIYYPNMSLIEIQQNNMGTLIMVSMLAVIF